MALRSLAVLGFASIVSAQSHTALPAVSAPATQSCGGCYLVADVAGILFGGVETTTQTNIVSVGSGRNGSLTTTTISQPGGKATFVSGAPVTVAGTLPTSFNPSDSTINVGGATLTSPTSYEVFSAYSVTRTIVGSDGQCTVTSSAPVTLTKASSYIIPKDAGADFLLEAESSFIADLGFPSSCSAGGGHVASTIHSMITTTTEHVTTTGFNRPTPVAVSTQAPSTTSEPSIFPGTTLVISNATATGPAATFTITPFLGAAARPVPVWSSWAAVALSGAMLVRWI